MAKKKLSRPAPNPPPGWGSIRAYAQHRKNKGLSGGSHPAVIGHIEAGRLTATNAKGWLEFARADEEWAQNVKDQHLPVEQRNGGGLTAPPAGGRSSVDDRRHYETELLRYKSEREQLEVEEKRGNLVEVAKVRTAGATLFRGIRDAILAVPSRVRSELVLAKSEAEAEAILRRELDAVLANPRLEELVA